MNDKPKVVAIIQARLGSTRLPKKVMKKILGKPMLGYLLERVARSQLVDQIIVATTLLSEDDEIANYCEQLGIRSFRGSKENVLERYVQSAEMAAAEVVVRITSDCPLLAPEVIDQVIERFLKLYPKIDYVANTLERTYPRGMDVEVFSYRSLKAASQQAARENEKEHVTLYIYQHPDQFILDSVTDESDHAHYRWTVDTLEDFQLISKMLHKIYPKNSHFSYQDLLNLAAEHPNWQKINSHIEQKKV